jgi:hypothetical protein
MEPKIMKKFKLIIGDVIRPVALPKNVYELKVSYMHGDADSYTSKELIFENPLSTEGFSLEKALLILEAYKNANRNSKSIPYGGISKLSVLLNIDEDILYEADEESFFQADVTSDFQYMAIIEGYKLFYWDENSNKYIVKCKPIES